jgi:preprotein translocase subunit SecF
VTAAGLSNPDVVSVQDPKNPYRFIIKVQEVSTISPEKRAEIERALCFGENLPAAECPPEKQTTEVKFSPGGDKVSVRFAEAAHPSLEEEHPPLLGWIRQFSWPAAASRTISGHVSSASPSATASAC